MNALIQAIAKQLAADLYQDIKNMLPTLWRRLRGAAERANTELFESPEAVLQAATSALIHDGDRITVECKPTAFAPYLRRHFLSAIIGGHTRNRLGPPIIGENPIMALIGQITTHWQPAGLFPSLDDGIAQCCLFPSDASVIGVISSMPTPLRAESPVYLSAIVDERHLVFREIPCHLTGRLRMVDGQTFSDAKFSSEHYDDAVRSGGVWFLDATGDDSDCSPLGDAERTEFWGALYASGHLEVEDVSQLDPETIARLIASVAKKSGFEPSTTPDLVRGDWMIDCRGFRAIVAGKAPIYSMHMDADLALDFNSARGRFDRICADALAGISAECNDKNAGLQNEFDLDFSYTNSTDAFKVLASMAANQLEDPLMIAIREWHRKRGV